MRLKYKSLLFLGLINIFFVNSYAQEIDSSSTQMLFDLSLEDLMNIEIVSAIKQNQHLSDAPSIVSVITSKQIKERGYTSVYEALNTVAGFDVMTDYFQPNLGIRGINGGVRSWSRLLKVMIDGQSVSFRSSSDNFLGMSLIPIDVIEKIEIIRGPNSAIYGKNAFLGVINIITKSGSKINGNSVSHFLESQGGNISFGLNTLISGKKEKLDYIFSSSYSQIDRSGLIPQNVPGSTLYNSTDKGQNEESYPLSVFFKLNYKEDKIGEISFDAGQQLIDSYTDFSDWGSLSHQNRISLFNTYERLTYLRANNEDFSTMFSFTHSKGTQAKNEIFENNSDPSDWIERDLGYTSYDVSGNFSYFFDDINSFTFGLDYITDIYNHQKYYTVNNSGLRTLNPGGTDGESTFNNLGIYLQMVFNAAEFFNIQYLKNLTLTAGYRFDYHNIYGDVLTYRLATVYHLTGNLTTKLMYGTSFNAPSSVQLYSNYISPGGIVGNPLLRPESAKTLEWAIMGKLSENINFNTGVFYTQIDDKIEYQLPYGQISNITSLNISNINSLGFETELNASFYNNTSYLNYSFQKSILEKQDPILQDIKLNTALYPSHMVKFGNIIHLERYFLNINIEGKYISKRIASDQNNFVYDPVGYSYNRYSLDSYFVFDLKFSTQDLKLFRNGKTRINFNIKNILNTEFYYPGYSQFDIPGLGRTFCFGFQQYM